MDESPHSATGSGGCSEPAGLAGARAWAQLTERLAIFCSFEKAPEIAGMLN